MWILIVLLLLLILIRQNKLLRTHLQNSLYSIGIQFGTHIYTPVCDVYSDSRYFDIVLLGKHHAHLHGYRVFHQQYFELPLKYVPVGHHLVHEIDGNSREHLYLDGTPFRVHTGQLVLYRKKRRGLGFISEVCERSNQWPF